MPFSDMSFTFYHHSPLYGESEENLVDVLIIEVTPVAAVPAAKLLM